MQLKELDTLIITIPALVVAISSAMSTWASYRAAKKTEAVHKLVNSAFSRELEKTAAALAKVAELDPTKENIRNADTAWKIVADRANQKS